MLLVMRICEKLSKPVFEVMTWPVSELEYWSTYLTLKPDDKPIVKKPKPENVSVDESKAKFKMLFH